MKYIKRIWFTIWTPFIAIYAATLMSCAYLKDVWQGERDNDEWMP